MKFLLKLFLFNLALFLLVGTAPAQVNVTTWQFDKQHWGNNNRETTLTPAKVAGSGNFDTLFTQKMVGVSYGQPLYVSNLKMANNTTHNVVFAATQHCMLYAFDADDKDAAKGNDKPLWVRTLFDPATSYPAPQKNSDSTHRDGFPGTITNGDVQPELGITTTPVVDLPSQTLFVVTKVVYSADLSFHQFLHAIDLTSGNERAGSPVEIYTTFPGLTNTGESPDIHVIPFNAQNQHLRAAMALDHGLLYLTYASHGDHTPYHGMVLAYDPASLQIVKKFIANNVGPDSNCGIWMAGASPGFDDAGNLYAMTGNGTWSHDSNGDDWSHTFIKLAPDTFNITKSNPLNWFTPYNWSDLNNGDRDLGAGGPLLLPDQSGPHPHLVLGGGKEGSIYVVDRDAMGGINSAQNNNNIVQVVPSSGNGFYNTAAYFNGYIYYGAGGDKLTQRAVGYNVSGPGTYVSTTPIRSDDPVGFRGATPFISSGGLDNGIVWIVSAGLKAYDAKSVAGKPIYQSGANVDGVACDAPKFASPTVANGKAYYTLYNKLATSNLPSSPNNASYLVVAGLFGQSTVRPKEPSDVSAMATSSSTVTLTWTDNSTNDVPAQTFVISRSTQKNAGYAPLPTRAPAGDRSQPVKTFSDSGLQPGTTYYYQVAASNSTGNSLNVGPAAATTFPAYVENGLVAFWNFDGIVGTTVPDVTGNGHAGTPQGEIGFVSGIVNSCFDTHGKGNDLSNIVVPNRADMQFTAQQSFTLAVWVKSSFFNPFDEAIIAKSRDVGNYYGLYIALNSDGSRTWSARGPNAALNLDGGPVGSGWTHLTLVQDGAAGRRYLYVNGVLANSGQAQAGDGTGALCMTQQNIGSNEASFAGDIDEVRLYNRPLAALEIPHLMGAPVLEMHSNLTHAGGVGPQGVSLWPGQTPKSEPRMGTGATQGQYTLVVSFASPASVDTVALQRRDGGAPVASMGQPSFDATGRVLTVPLSGVGNAQALNLHLANVTPGGGTMDIPFNVLWGDVNGDGIVNGIDLRSVRGSELNPAAVVPFPTTKGAVTATAPPGNPSAVATGANCQYDLNGDGKVDDADAALLNNPSIANTSVTGGQTDTNLAFYGSANISSISGGSTLLGAFDNDAVNTRLDTVEGNGVDPQWIMVDLGSVCTIHQVVLRWQAAGKNYSVDVSNDLNGADPRPDLPGGSNWVNYATEVNNTDPRLNRTYTKTMTGRYVRMYGTARATAYGYAPYEFQVIGLSGPGGNPPAAPRPVVSAIPVQNVAAGAGFSYQLSATNNPTNYAVAGIPWLSVNNSGLVTGTAPTSGGTYTASVTATNAGGTSDPVALQVNVSATPTGSKPVVSAIPTQNVTSGSAFSYQASATNNPTGYGVSGVPWLSVSNSGLISGTVPAGNGSYTAVVAATNAYGTSDGVSLQINATAPAAPRPVVSAIPVQNVAAGAGFSYQLSATNNPTNYAVAGIPWLSVNNSGLVTGTVPADGGPYAGSVTATNAGGTSDPVTLQVNVRPAVTGALSSSVATGAAFSYQITATNSPNSYAVNGQSWLSVSAGGVVSGTAPATPGTYTATISATNAAGTSPNATLTITVTSAPTGTLTNVALYQQAWASSVETAGYAANRAVDGDKTGSRWSSAKNDAEWLTVDLGVPTPLSQVVLVWEGAYGKRYVIQGSNDLNAAWTALYTQDNGVGKTETLPVSGTYRYVRMQGVQRAGGYGYSLYEFQVMSAQPPVWTNKAQAPGVTATASSSESAGLSPNLAIDGRRDTRWSSAQTDNEFLEINFGTPTAISQVSLSWENAYAARYVIEATNDKAAGWTLLVIQDAGVGGTETFNFNGGSYQYLRMRGVKRGSAFGYSLWELQVR